MFLMGVVVDTLYDVCIEIQKDGGKMLEKDFIMIIFDNIGKVIPEFQNDLEYFFEIKKSRTVATRKLVLPFEELTADLFYPNRAEKRSTTHVATILASKAATMIMTELIDTRRANSKPF